MTRLDPNGSGALRVVPLGGLGEIGLNCLVLEYNGRAIAIDCGLMFPDSYMLGVDRVIPDLSYLRQLGAGFLGFVMTHGHEDHIGALPYILRDLPAPIHATPLAAELLRERLREQELLDQTQLHVVRPGDIWEMGPFTIEPIHMTHSIMDAAALAIRTPLGLVIHTGDFKLDETPIDGRKSDLERLASYAREGVLLMLSDSTNAEVPGRTPSERSVHGEIDQIFRDTPGRLFFSTFSSHVHRLSQVIELSQRYGRRISVVGRSMNTSLKIATQLGYLEYAPSLFVENGELRNLPPEKVTHLITGSQAEPLSALVRIAEGNDKHVKMESGDSVVLSARVIPGNERPITNLVNHVYRRGARVYHSGNSDVHTSGHASRDELVELLQLIRPRYFAPVHGEYRHLVEHRKIAQQAGVSPEGTFLIEDGNVLEIDAKGARLAAPVAAGRVFVDGKGIGDVEKAVLRDRRHLSSDGFVLVVLAIDQRNGELIAGPDLVTRGVTLEEADSGYLEQAKAVVVEALARTSAESRTDSIEVKEEVRKALKRFFARALERRPVIIPFIMEM